MNSLLNKIKQEFELIPSTCAFEEFTNGIRIYNDCLSFYTYSKRYFELCSIVEMLYIASELNIPEFPIDFQDYFYPIIHRECAFINKINHKIFLSIDKLRLFKEIKKCIYFFKSQNKKIKFLNRVEWGEPQVYKNRFYCRRRLALYIYNNTTKQVKPETDREKADKRYSKLVNR